LVASSFLAFGDGEYFPKISVAKVYIRCTKQSVNIRKTANFLEDASEGLFSKNIPTRIKIVRLNVSDV